MWAWGCLASCQSSPAPSIPRPGSRMGWTSSLGSTILGSGSKQVPIAGNLCPNPRLQTLKLTSSRWRWHASCWSHRTCSKLSNPANHQLFSFRNMNGTGLLPCWLILVKAADPDSTGQFLSANSSRQACSHLPTEKTPLGCHEASARLHHKDHKVPAGSGLRWPLEQETQATKVNTWHGSPTPGTLSKGTGVASEKLSSEPQAHQEQ